MMNHPVGQSTAWYHDSLSLDDETFAKGFGLSLKAWNKLRATMSKRAFEVKRPVSCYSRFCPRDIAHLLYREFSSQLAWAVTDWTFNSLEYVVKEAYSSKTEAEYEERFKDDYTPEGAPNLEPAVSEIAGAENRSTVNNESANSVEPVIKDQPCMTNGFTSGAGSPTERASDSLFTPSSSSGETALSQFLIPTNLPRPNGQPDENTLSTRIDPVKKALKLHVYIQSETSGFERLIGVFSTQFLCHPSKSSSPPMVSLKLVQDAAMQTLEQTVKNPLWIREVEDVFLDKWSVPDLAIYDDITLNTAINEILEQGNTTAKLRIPILSSCSSVKTSTSGQAHQSSGESSRPSKVTKKVLKTPVHRKK